MHDIIEIAKNFSIFIVFCMFAGLSGVWFFMTCFLNHDKRFIGTISERIRNMVCVTLHYIRWKANHLLGENVFSLTA